MWNMYMYILFENKLSLKHEPIASMYLLLWIVILLVIVISF